MSDPTYDHEVIRKNPIWNEAFILSEVLNDNAPLGWGRYVYAAEELALAQDAQMARQIISMREAEKEYPE